jgi:hypothetical protein
MDTDIAISTDEAVDSTNHRFAKIMIGTAAAFIATHLVTAGYDAIVKNRRAKSAASEQ